MTSARSRADAAMRTAWGSPCNSGPCATSAGLENPAAVPAQVVGWTAREIGVSASVDLVSYGEGEWRWSHQAEIRRIYGYRPFSSEGVEPELVEWLRARAWVTAESSRALFARASELLMGRRILLPGWSTLWRLVGAARESAVSGAGACSPPR
jgi:hypothetical protein